LLPSYPAAGAPDDITVPPSLWSWIVHSRPMRLAMIVALSGTVLWATLCMVSIGEQEAKAVAVEEIKARQGWTPIDLYASRRLLGGWSVTGTLFARAYNADLTSHRNYEFKTRVQVDLRGSVISYVRLQE
jgi:hypothetical protein